MQIERVKWLKLFDRTDAPGADRREMSRKIRGLAAEIIEQPIL